MRWKAAPWAITAEASSRPTCVERDAAALSAHLTTINRLLAAMSFPPLASADIASGPAQLKVLADSQPSLEKD
jgi:hypothetical protein